jgi:tetratricopeptide (TPR) repeat protein
MPHNLEILVSQTTIAQEAKDNAKIIDYACQGGEAYHSLLKSPKPEGMSDQDFASRMEDAKSAMANSYQFLEAAAFNAIAGSPDAKQRMSFIERYTPAFPDSQYDQQVTSYAMVSLSELKDVNRLVAYGEKTLATNPENLPALLLLANAYSEDAKPGSSAKAIAYAQKAITVAKADAPDADRSRKLSAGAAHSTLGYVYMKQDKTAAAIPELKTAASLLKGQDDQSYALAAYRLGFAYAKLNRVNEAREVLSDSVKIAGPLQAMTEELLTKVNAARAGKK